MGIMNILRRVSNKDDDFKQRLKEAQHEDKIETMIEERKKSSNRRELEKVMHDREEAQIKVALDKVRKERSKEFWKSKNNSLDKGSSMLKEDRPILKEKNLFKHQRSNMLQGGMFFK